MTLEENNPNPQQQKEWLSNMSNTEFDHLDSLPDIEKVKTLLELLSKELLATLTNDQDPNQFYLPFIIFLLTVVNNTGRKLDELWSGPEVPFEIIVELEPGYQIKVPIINQFFNSGQEDLIFKYMQIRDWLTFFSEQLQDIASEYFATQLAKEAQEQLTPGQLETLEEDAITGRLNEIAQEAFTISGGFYPEPFDWNTTIIHGIAQWLTTILEPEYRPGPSPFYIFIKNVPSSLPQIYGENRWVTGFGGRLTVPNLDMLSDRQKAAVWSRLFFEENIYGDNNIDHSVRAEVFDQIEKNIPQFAKHLDLCGGMGHFITFLKTRRPDLESILIDITPEAVEYARNLGIDARVGNADKSLKLDEEMDVVTINFAVQWISRTAFENILEVLKPGGLLTFNAYPIAEIEAVKYVDLLKELGFANVRYKESQGVKKISYIVSAYKPLLKE